MTFANIACSRWCVRGGCSLPPSPAFARLPPPAKAVSSLPLFSATPIPPPSSRFPPHRPRTHQRSAAALCASLSRKGNFLIYASDDSFSAGSMQAYRLDLKNGQARLLTDARELRSCLLYAAGRRAKLLLRRRRPAVLEQSDVAPAAPGVSGSGRVSTHRHEHHRRRAFGCDRGKGARRARITACS